MSNWLTFKLRDYPGLFGLAQCGYSLKVELKVRRVSGRFMKYETGRQSPRLYTWGCGLLLEAGKDKMNSSLGAFRKDCNPATF